MIDHTALLLGLREYQQFVLPPMLTEAADAIEALRDECERLRAELAAAQKDGRKIGEDAYRQLMKHAHRLAMDGHGELAQHLRDAICGRGPWETRDDQ